MGNTEMLNAVKENKMNDEKLEKISGGTACHNTNDQQNRPFHGLTRPDNDGGIDSSGSGK